MSPSAGNPLNLAIIGAGLVSDYHHVPGILLDPRARVAAVCDTDEALLEKRKADWDVEKVTTDPGEIFSDPGIDAVIIATPNFTHPSLAIDAARSGKHIMCEKPLGLNAPEGAGMYGAAKTAGVVHMTAFTYRFAPSMRYLKHLVEN
ncbi:MAG: Gfo/Idh/MocA family oxidoreductase, partial [Planctomycetota bacterium]|nr:Gfo/Idh/MocA family oxidoreductase [Planctomycetota bacterium]